MGPKIVVRKINGGYEVSTTEYTREAPKISKFHTCNLKINGVVK